MIYNTPQQPRNPSRPLSRGEFVWRFLGFIVVIAIALLPSCKPDNLPNGAAPKYFDLKGYFKADAERYKKLNHITTKKVAHNGVVELKKLHINNWELELSLFSQSDINKPAWRDSYNTQRTDDVEIDTAKYPDLKTREIIVNKTGEKIKWILIKNSTNNWLYQTKEQLSYFPDSVYIIQKYQKIRGLKADTYFIKGSLN